MLSANRDACPLITAAAVITVHRDRRWLRGAACHTERRCSRQDLKISATRFVYRRIVANDLLTRSKLCWIIVYRKVLALTVRGSRKSEHPSSISLINSASSSCLHLLQRYHLLQSCGYNDISMKLLRNNYTFRKRKQCRTIVFGHTQYANSYIIYSNPKPPCL